MAGGGATLILALAALVTLLVLALVFLPLLVSQRRAQRPRTSEELGWRYLLEQRESALTALQELDFDHALGNMSAEHYRELGERYRRRAAAIQKALENHHVAEEDVEAAILAARRRLTAQAGSQPFTEGGP